MLGDPPFNQFNNHYDEKSDNRICNEFGIIRIAGTAFGVIANNSPTNSWLFAFSIDSFEYFLALLEI